VKKKGDRRPPQIHAWEALACDAPSAPVNLAAVARALRRTASLRVSTAG